MAKKKVGKSVVATAITLSLVCTTGVTALATESGQVQEVTSETSMTGVQQENSTTNQPEVSIESSSNEEISQGGTSKPESSKQEEVSKGEVSKYPTEDVTIQFCIDLGSPVLSCTNDYVTGNFSLSEYDISFKVTDDTGKKVYGKYTVSDKNLIDLENNRLLQGFTVKVPKWDKGVSYKVVFDKLPSFFTKRSCDLNYAVRYPESDSSNTSSGKVSGLDMPVSGILGDEDTRTIAIKAQDMSGRVIPNALIGVTVKGLEEHTKSASLEKTLTADSSGYAYLTLPTDAEFKGLLEITANLLTSTNTELGSKSWITEYDYNTRDSLTLGVVLTNMTLEDYNKSIEETKETAKLSVNASFKNAENMELFKSEPVSVSIYDSEGKSIVGTIDLDKNSASGSLLLIKGESYQVKVNSTGTYACNMGNSSFTMSDDKELNLEFTPQIFLRIYNEKSGVQNNANFSISAGDTSKKTYSGQPVRVFALNAGTSATIVNNDNDEMYSVAIPDGASTTKLNLATGSLGVNFVDSANGSVTGDGSDTVPQTGDAMPYIIGGMVLVTAGCFSGWVYYKKKGDKFNEKKKKDEQK